MARSMAGRLLLYTFLALFSGCGYIELGCGTSSTSVTAPGKDGERVLAKSEAGGTRAKLVLERKTRRVVGRGEVRYLFSKSLTEQWLRLILADGGKEATFTPAVHDEASSFATLGLEVAPDGRRVAYRLGGRPWRVVYVLTSTLAVQRREPVAGDGALDWNAVPTFDDAFVELFKAQQQQLNEMYSFHKKPLMLRFIRSEQGQQGLADALFALIVNDDYEWDAYVNEMLTDDGRAHLQSRLREVTATKEATPRQYSKALRVGALDPTATDSAPVVAAAVAVLAVDETTLANRGDDLLAFLKAHAQHDPTDAQRVACRLLETPGTPYALGEGRPLRIAADALCRAED